VQFLPALHLNWRTFITAILLASGLSGLAQSPKIKVLLVEGVSNHDWKHRADIVRSILAKDGSFDVTVTVTPSAAGDPAWATWRPAFSNYNVVLSGYNNLGGKPQWPAEVQAAFTNYVKSGGGFFCYHEANNSFAEWPEYNRIIGLGWRDVNFGTAIIVNSNETLQFVPAGSGTGTSHGSRVNALVRRMNNHAIHQGLPPAWIAADVEIYRYARGPATNLTVLSYAKDPTTQIQFPMEWVVHYGQGRTYASSYGHVWADQTQPEGTRCAAFQTILVRALKWLAGRDPGMNTPVDFPTTNAPSLRPYSRGVSGLDQAQAVGAFANGKLPTQSTPPGSVLVQPALTNLLWESPVEAKPWPGSTDLLIAEMDGRFFRVADDDTTTNRPLVLDIRDRAWYYNWTIGNSTTKHGGVQSMTFHPRFGLGEGKDFLYIFYLHHPTDNPDASPPYYDRLVRFAWNPANATFTNELILINQYDTVKGHDGGGMTFGADGFLYISFGDEGTQDGASTPHTQKINDRVRSGTWRLDVDQQGGNVSHAIRRQPVNASPGHGSYTQGYFVPNSNPWLDPGGGVLEEFYSLGLRNPFRMSFDPVTGLFWIGDVGGGSREEVDVLDAPMLNFQWNYREGTANGFRSMPSPLIGIDRGPVHDYSHSVGDCIIMGYVYRGSAIPWLNGRVLFGDNGTQKIYALDYDPVTKTMLSLVEIGTGPSGSLFSGLSSITRTAAGEPLLLKLGAGVNGSGRISRIKPNPGVVDNSRFPTNLSATGLFTNLATLAPAPWLIPYDINMPLWSAGLDKRRWMMIPNDGTPNSSAEQIAYNATGSWLFPTGSVLVKHFAMPGTGQKLETRVLVRGTDGGWGGVTYKWLPNGSDAALEEAGAVETLNIEGDTVQYLYPSRGQCTFCHTALAGPLLGLRTRQLNRRLTYPGTGREANQIETLSALGFLATNITEVDLANTLSSASVNDPLVSDERFTRSYLDSNCAHCHQPGGNNQALFDARLTTALANQNIVCGAVLDGLGLISPAVVKPAQLDKSVMFQRMNTMDECCSMPPLAKGRVDAQAVARLANWILGMDADSCTQGVTSGNQPFALGNGNTPGSGSVDSWYANMVINETDTYTNTTGAPLLLDLQRFQFHATRVTDPLTPFIVRINGDNNFTVLAIGTPRSSYTAGTNDFPFSDTAMQLTLAAGEIIGIGFLDALPNGTGGTQNGAVTYASGGGTDQIHYSGGSSDANSGSVTVGQPPVFGTNVRTDFGRNYYFTITFVPAGTQISLGNGTVPGASPNVDSWHANMVINETDIYTNTTGAPLLVSPQRFRFHATRVTDPITPFLVRINGDNNFTVLAVGTPRGSYVVGSNDFAFANTATMFTLSPGEKIGIGFLDALPDGTGGTQNGAITYVSGAGTDQIHYSGGSSDANSGSVTVGQPPVFGSTVYTTFGRNYYFTITLRTGAEVVNPDSDSDVLPDSWELAFSSNLNLLSANADYDSDGMSDAAERLAGTNPTDPASRFEVFELRPQPGTTNLLATFGSVPGRDYRLWVTHDLGTWTDRGIVRSADWPATVTSVQLAAAGLPAGANQRLFLRASVVR